MTENAITITLPVPGRGSIRRAARRMLGGAAVATSAFLAAVGTRSRPAVKHLTDHIYSLFAFGCASAAGFYHSVFTGLVVTAVGWVIFEWKVSDEGDSHS